MKAIAPIIAVVLLVAVAVFVFTQEKDSATDLPSTPNPMADLAVTPPSTVAVDSTSAMPAPITLQASPVVKGGGQVAPMLGDLVGRIEEKVKSDPSNIGNQILLAQTYSELGRNDDGIAVLRKIPAGKPETPRAQIVLASLLSKTGQPDAYNEAFKLLDTAAKADAAQKGYAELYRGKIYLGQGKRDLAIKTWETALKKLPAADNARSQIDDELSKSRLN